MEKNKKEELQSRRQFFKKAAKSALPILGAIALANVPVISKASEVAMGCTGYCREGCGTSCTGSCTGGCLNQCARSCTACSNGCASGCHATCYTGCNGKNKGYA